MSAVGDVDEVGQSCREKPRGDHLRFKIIDLAHGIRCRGVVIHASDGILCLLCGKTWACPCVSQLPGVKS